MNLLQGVAAIHAHPTIKFHGSLCSYLCGITNHFGLKICGLGCDRLLQYTGLNRGTHLLGDLFTFPESGETRVQITDRRPNDIYAAGAICTEIFTERVVLKSDREHLITLVANLPPKENLKYGAVLLSCFDSDATRRPTVKKLKQAFSPKRKKVTVMERLLQRLAKYSMELEHLVGLKTQELLLERSKCDEILLHILPAAVVEALRKHEKILPEPFDSVTIMFSDIVGFVQFVASVTPYQVIEFLNTVHGLSDKIICDFDVYKVETIGDIYFIVSGLPVRNGITHAAEICYTAVTFLQVFSTKLRSFDESMAIRIGIHTEGPCIASVVGLQRPRYCLFGDTVNTASRMESCGEPNRIHISPMTTELIRNNTAFRCVLRGSILVKGKGEMTTFWLEKRDLL
ncbi:atrial natriuretic peptide receptor 1-like [Paramacrobiotus metropolitanus]|uniref:atrial natriuretic peptide receptor 1-like n=1 Tax=Paramacrobiotus metropolitanus TaxID=2943436 RepID=UPI00244615DC|nr:atrial natriuretic peptide receptor 1-like [Paramacrobiotus metropolitanus]